MRTCSALSRATVLAFVLTVLLPLVPARSTAALRPVAVHLGDRALALSPPPVSDGTEVYVPLSFLAALKASYRLTPHEDAALVTRERRTTEIALARPGRQAMLPLSVVARAFGLSWLVVEGSCAIWPSGERPPLAARERQAAARHEPGTRAGPADAAATRRQGEHPAQPPARALATKGAPDDEPAPRRSEPPAEPEPADGKGSAPNEPPTAPVQAPGSPDGGAPAQPASPPDAATAAPRPAPRPGDARITDVRFEPIDDGRVRIRVVTDRKARATASLLSDPSRLAVDIANASAATLDRDEWTVDHPLLRAFRVLAGGKPGVTRLVVDLARLVGYRVQQTASDGLAIYLSLPRNQVRSINDLTVVIDPGHGGRSTGCSAVVSGKRVYEKSVTLAFGKRVHALLAGLGANVMLTRADDSDVGLAERPAMATENNAHLFVSIHIDDCRVANSASGTTAYYHMGDASSRALAQSLVARIARVSGLPSRGAQSDRVLYASGLAVLRHSTTPAALVEVGYINNARDRQKLLSPEFQDVVAQAIVDGILAYVEAELPEGSPPIAAEE